MRRQAICCTIVLFIVICIGLSRTAVKPADFNGQWYASDNQNAYLFQEGLIFCGKEDGFSRDNVPICGAYIYCKDSVCLFVQGIDGLEKETELYLIYREDASFLCDRKDGNGRIYFIRYRNKT